MIESRNRVIVLAFHLAFGIVLFCSCTNCSTVKEKPVDVSISNNIRPGASIIDTSKQLKFTSMVRSIFEDSKGNFWFGSDREGVCLYDGNSFTYFTTNEGLCHNQVRTIQEDEHGLIWFATGHGISSYNGDEFTTHPSKFDFTGLANFASNEWKKETNDNWFNGEHGGGIYRYNGQYLSILKFPILDSDHESFSISGTVTGICEGKNGMLWIANYGGVIGYDGNSFKYINERGVNYHVRSIFEDSKGHLWIGNNGIGALCYDGNNTVKLSDKSGLASNSPSDFPYHVFSIAEDRLGNIWIGDRDSGAWCYDGKRLTNYTKKDGLTNTFVRVIYKDQRGELWVGLEHGDVCKFNGVSFDKMF